MGKLNNVRAQWKIQRKINTVRQLTMGKIRKINSTPFNHGDNKTTKRKKNSFPDIWEKPAAQKDLKILDFFFLGNLFFLHINLSIRSVGKSMME